MTNDVFLVRSSLGSYGKKVNGFVVFDSLDKALIDFDAKVRFYGSWTVKPVITAYTFGQPGGRKINKAERNAAQRRLGLKEV